MPPVGFEPTISAGERPAAARLLRIQVSEKLYPHNGIRPSFGNNASETRRKRKKMTSLLVINIERHEKYKVDSKTKTAVCALRMQK